MVGRSCGAARRMELKREKANKDAEHDPGAAHHGALSRVRAALFDVDGTLTPERPWHAAAVAGRRWPEGLAVRHGNAALLSARRLLNQAGVRDRWVRLMAWLMTVGHTGG